MVLGHDRHRCLIDQNVLIKAPLDSGSGNGFCPSEQGIVGFSGLHIHQNICSTWECLNNRWREKLSD
jgi:hypothetical protein